MPVVTKVMLYILALGLWPGAVFAVGDASLAVTDLVTASNEARNEYNILPLTSDSALMRAAQAKADLMVSRNEFAHTFMDGTSPWQFVRESGYQYKAAGENLAVHFESGSAVVAAWLSSPLHRDNLLNPTYQDIGIGIAKGEWDGYPGYFVVQFLGLRIDT